MNIMQPYVQNHTLDYKSIPSLDSNVFQYYEFREKESTKEINAVPDGCVDLLYAITPKKVRCYMGGTVLKLKYWPFEDNRTYFGVRFRPGNVILPKDITMKDIINEDIEIPVNCYGVDVEEALFKAEHIEDRVQCMNEMFASMRKKVEELNAKREIERYIRKRIYDTTGTISIKTMAEETGYSECYVRRTFHEIHGISPKVFEKIVRFQNALEQMNKHKEMSIFELAQESGYYDQSHMVKEFKQYMGMTPDMYKKHVEAR